MIFPILFWYRYITNFVTHILHRRSRFTQLKWFILTISVPLALSIFIPILITAIVLFIFNLQNSLSEVFCYLQELQPNHSITLIKVIFFLLFQRLFFSIILLILCIPQFVIQYYLNKIKLIPSA